MVSGDHRPRAHGDPVRPEDRSDPARDRPAVARHSLGGAERPKRINRRLPSACPIAFRSANE